MNQTIKYHGNSEGGAGGALAPLHLKMNSIYLYKTCKMYIKITLSIGITA